MNKDDFLAFVTFFFIGFFSMGILMKNFSTVLTTGTEAIVECEKSLPRDQKCKLIAVPEEKK